MIGNYCSPGFPTLTHSPQLVDRIVARRYDVPRIGRTRCSRRPPSLPLPPVLGADYTREEQVTARQKCEILVDAVCNPRRLATIKIPLIPKYSEGSNTSHNPINPVQSESKQQSLFTNYSKFRTLISSYKSCDKLSKTIV